MDGLRQCQCGRKAIKTTERFQIGERGLALCKTTIRCEGKTEATKDLPGCNMRCSASDEDTAVKMWNTQQDIEDLNSALIVRKCMFKASVKVNKRLRAENKELRENINSLKLQCNYYGRKLVLHGEDEIVFYSI